MSINTNGDWSFQTTDSSGNIAFSHEHPAIGENGQAVGLSEDYAMRLMRSLSIKNIESVIFQTIKANGHYDRELLIEVCICGLIQTFFIFLKDNHGSFEYAIPYFKEITNIYFQDFIDHEKIKFEVDILRFVVIDQSTHKYPTLCNGYGDKNG